jgi:hypothetical protein
MSKTIKTELGITVRFIEALNGFRKKHGYWPDRIEAPGATIASLATEYLTPLGFFLLQSKVELAVGPEGALVARGGEEDTFDYGREGLQTGKYKHDARAWLGLDE